MPSLPNLRLKESHHSSSQPNFSQRAIQDVGHQLCGTYNAGQWRIFYIIIATKYFTKWPVALATKTHDAATVAKFLYNHIFTIFGPPTHLLSDQGTEFDNELVKGLISQARVDHKLTTSYNPWCNRLTELFNKTLFAALEKCSSLNPDTWYVHIPRVLWTYRTQIHSLLQCTPYELLFGMMYIANPLQKKLPTDSARNLLPRNEPKPTPKPKKRPQQ